MFWDFTAFIALLGRRGSPRDENKDCFSSSFSFGCGVGHHLLKVGY